MYSNVVFDLGNVLLSFKPEEYLRTKISEGDKILEVYNAVFQSQEWIMLDRGILTEEEAKVILIKGNSIIGNLIELALENWYELLTPIEGTVKVLKDLKNAGYKVYFLSNFHLSAFEYVTKKYDFFRLFDGGIVSFKEKLIKPEEEIYKRIVDEYGIKPEESVFVDDVQENIEVAKKLHFETITFKNPEDLREKLISFNIYI